MAKLEHLQFLRGIAVLAVVLYHFFPTLVPNGFVGVDMFFVLSGFLMMMVFGSREITFKKSLDFYYRRVKRIVPMYLIALLLTLAAVYFIFPLVFVLENADPQVPALFYTNINNMNSADAYFQQLARGSYLYTHTWSLGVEMQFYVFAPLFFFVQVKLGELHLLAECAFLAFVFYASLVSNAFFNDTITFNSLPCRLWQFAAGIICYRLTQVYYAKETKEDKKPIVDITPDSLSESAMEKGIPAPKVEIDPHSVARQTTGCLLFFTLLIALLVLVFVPIKESMTTMRILATLITVSLIVIEPFQRISPMKNRAICYIGDISYSLYLIHWAVCVYARYTYDQYSYQYFIAFALCFVLSVLSYELIEKSYLKLGKISIGVMITVLYVALFAVIAGKDTLTMKTYKHWKNDIEQFNQSALTKENIVKMNEVADFFDHWQLMDFTCFPNSVFGHCDYRSPKLGAKSNMSMLVVGNSYASNQMGLVEEHFGPYASSIKRLSRESCQPLTARPWGDCVNYEPEFRSFVVQEQPDVLFLIARCLGNAQATLQDSLEEDQYVQEMERNLETFEKAVKKRIYVLNCIPQVSEPATAFYMGKLNKLIRNEKTINSDDLIGDRNHINGRKRMEHAVKSCSKCVLFDYMPSMSDENGFHVADPHTNLSYYTAYSHLTKYGLDAVSPVFQRLAREFEHDLVNATISHI